MVLKEMGRDLLGPVRELGEYIREQRTAAEISLRALAEKAGISNPYLSQVERGLRRPSAMILTQIAEGLSISAESLLVKAGILREEETAPVIAAIHADPDLTERQKLTLIDIYRALRHETRSMTSPADDETTPAAADTAADGAQPDSATTTSGIMKE